MVQTLFYQAGVEANQTQLSYANEATWGVKPGVRFQAIRYTGDTLALTKTRQRPNEINISREVSQAVTTTQTAGGTINYAFSWGTYDDFLASLCQGEWSHTPPFKIFSILADITMTVAAGVKTLSSTLAGKFTTIQVGQYVRLSGFNTVAYNTWFLVTANTGQSMTLVAPTIANGTETSVTTNQVQVSGSRLNNGTTFKSLFVQQKFTNVMWLRYGGCYVTRMTLGASVGAFFTGAIDVVAQSEVSATADGSVGGAVLAAPPGTVVDPVAGYVRMTYNNGTSTIAGNIDQLQMTMENTAAAPEFGLGATAAGVAGAIGILGGTFTASGTMRLYCKDFVLYDAFQAEQAGDVQLYLQDSSRASYVIQLQNVVFLCKINATGPGAALMIDVTFECNPDPTVGGTFQIDRFPPPN
jgi:hypothetical protein